MILFRNKTRYLWNILKYLTVNPQYNFEEIDKDLINIGIESLDQKEKNRVIHIHNSFTIFNSFFSISYETKIGNDLILSLHFMSKKMAYLVLFKKSYIAIFEGLGKGGKNG